MGAASFLSAKALLVTSSTAVIPGLNPGIHLAGGTMDARIKSGHDR